MVERGHVDQVAPGQRDVAGDARAFLAERLLGDLDDDFLALLEHVGDQLRAARLRAMAVTAVAAVMRTAAAIVAAASTAVASAAASRVLHARAEIVAAHTGLPGLALRRIALSGCG